MRKLWMQRQWKMMSIVVIAGAMLLATHLPLAAQEEPPLSGQLRTFLLLGGSFQIVDATGEACLGQCAVPNVRTGECLCPEGYTPVGSARILIDAIDAQGEPTSCGSTLVMCLR